MNHALPRERVSVQQALELYTFNAAHTTGSSNQLLALGSASQSVARVSVARGLVGLALLGSPWAGAMVVWMGFDMLSTVSLVSALVALVLATGLGEPR